MSSGLKITVKSGERIYINGAVLKMDRKVGIELMNEATFLLEQHILQPEGATTPLRQLYFMVQMMLIDPSLHARALGMAKETIAALHAAIQDKQIILGLGEVSSMIDADRPLHALKKIRAMYPLEVSSSERATAAGKTQKEVA